MFTKENIVDAYMAHLIEARAAVNRVSPEVEATRDILVVDSNANKPDYDTMEKMVQVQIDALYRGQEILRGAVLIVGGRQLSCLTSIESQDAPTVMMDAGYIATSPSWRPVTLRKRKGGEI